jgi:hypothetical protein
MSDPAPAATNEVKKEEAPAAADGEAPPAPAAAGRGPRRGPKGEKTCYNCGEVRRLFMSPVWLSVLGHILTTLFLSLFERFRVVTLPGTVKILDWKVKIGWLSTRPALSIAAASTAERWVTSLPNVPSPRETRLATTVEERVTLPRSALTQGKQRKSSFAF